MKTAEKVIIAAVCAAVAASGTFGGYKYNQIRKKNKAILANEFDLSKRLPCKNAGAFWAYNLLLSRPWQQFPRSFAEIAQHEHERSGDEQPQRGKAC